MTYNHATSANIAYFAKISKMPPVVVHAWLDCETQANNNPTNPLNIRYYGSHSLQIGQSHGFGVYHTPEDGLRDAWGTLQLPYYASVRKAIIGNNPMMIARAIELSPWAAGHYGGTSVGYGCIRRGVSRLLAVKPPPTFKYYTIIHGDTLSGIAHKFGIADWHTLYNYATNKKIIGDDPSLIHPGTKIKIPLK
jgi:hypothetical protein